MNDRTVLRTSKRQRGFTLVEILVVIAIVGMLVGFVGPRVFALFGGAQEDHAFSEVRRILESVELYVVKTQDHQPSMEKLVTEDNKGRQWLQTSTAGEVPKDPWGTPYEIRAGDKRGKWVVISYGPDKLADSDDDIRSDKSKDAETR